MASAGGATHVPHLRSERNSCRVQHQGSAQIHFPGFSTEGVGLLRGHLQKHGIFVHAIGGVEDHAHFLIQLPPVMALAKAVATIKSNSSRWANEEGHKLAWQQGYGAFSVSASIVPAVVRYIQNQEAHHRKMSFDEEFVALLRKHGVEYDPKFVYG